ncbi:hypothetical protein V6N12_002135 [Hibiscus sabdariffa]|uniref:Uncharacterized protein n=1 Tax=Hibiscus sabdariffa TaxID=183260 RepID=A0ABR2AZ95_9ROSI
MGEPKTLNLFSKLVLPPPSWSSMDLASTLVSSFFLFFDSLFDYISTFINQAKYIKEKLKKFGLENVKPQAAHMSSSIKLDKDEGGKCVDSKIYRSMIGSLLYLTASRPDIMFSVCLCARFQAHPKESHLKAVKRIFRYLKDTPSLGLWYPRDSTFDLHAYSDTDYGGCKIDRNSTPVLVNS